ALGAGALGRTPGLNERYRGEHRPDRAGGNRRSGEELASAQVDFIGSDDCVLRHPTALPLNHTPAARSFAVRRRAAHACAQRDFVPARGGALYTNEHPLPGVPVAVRTPFSRSALMLGRLGSALVFVAGSVVGGLALAFLIVALRPELI